MSKYDELKRLAEKVLSLTKDDPEWDDAWNHYEAASVPEVVVALIAENKALRKEVARLKKDNLELLENPGDAL